LAITGIFTGLGVAIGGSINKLWLEPKLERLMKKGNLKKVLRKKKMLNDNQKRNLKIFIGIALILFGLICLVRASHIANEIEQEKSYLKDCKSYCGELFKTEANPLTRSTKFCEICAIHFSEATR